MKCHNRVKDKWPYCSSAELQGDALVYRVDGRRGYNLANRDFRLHVLFLNLKTDEDLVKFLRAWGPLWQTAPEKGKLEISVPRSQYWAFQSKLKAELALVQSCNLDDATGLRAALIKYIAALDAQSPEGMALIRDMLGTYFAGNPIRTLEDWIQNAHISNLREVAFFCITGYSSFRLQSAWQDGNLRISWEPDVTTLADAIQVGLWNSLVGERVPTICKECQTVFVPESAHQRKFCSYKCAHLAAVRASLKRKTEEKSERKRGRHVKAKKA